MTKPTQADLDGTSERGRAAYNERRRYLRDNGIALIRDLYNDDEWDDETDPTGAQRFWRRYAAERAENVAFEAETQRLVDLANNDGVRRH